MAFLRHFDVKLSAEERPEMLLGGHATDHDPGVLRYYYSDFLLLPEFMPPFKDTNPIVELTQIKEYIEMIQVRVCVCVVGCMCECEHSSFLIFYVDYCLVKLYCDIRRE